MDTVPQPEQTSDEAGEDGRRHLYRSLPGLRSFRTLLLSKGAGNDPLHGTILQPLPVDQCKHYEALSYRWSDFDARSATYIKIGGFSLPIGHHLHAALTQFRRPDCDRQLWVDQICIDQEDDNDKAQQVAIMADIYSNASRVLVWLTPSNERADIAMEFFPVMVDRVQRIGDAARAGVQSEIPAAIPPRYGILATALYSLFSCDWFLRVWTLQEAALSKTGEVWCGQKSFPLEVLNQFQAGCDHDPHGHWATALDLIQSGSGGGSDPEQPRPPINTHISVITKLRRRPRLSNARLLNSVRFVGCSRHEDRINSIAHFLEPELKEALIRHPGLDAAAIFHLVACHEICRGEMEHLCAAGLWQRRVGSRPEGSAQVKDRPLSLPSWVPDWTHTIRSHSFWVYNSERLEHEGEPLFAAGGTTAGRSPRILPQDDNVLIIEAIVFDKVKACAEYFHGEKVPADVTDAKAVLDTIQASASFIQTYIASSMALAQAPLWTCPQYSNRFTSVFTRISDQAVSKLYTDFEARNRMIDKLAQYAQQTTTEGLAYTEMMETYRTSIAVIIAGNELVGRMAEVCKGRRFVTTAKGYVGLAPDLTQEGDEVCVIPGCPAPFVLRWEGDGYRLVGECYVDGIMDGEVMRDAGSTCATIRIV